MSYRVYVDGCIAVVSRNGWRGPCSPSRKIALARWKRSGYIARSNTGT